MPGRLPTIIHKPSRYPLKSILTDGVSLLSWQALEDTGCLYLHCMKTIKRRWRIWSSENDDLCLDCVLDWFLN